MYQDQSTITESLSVCDAITQYSTLEEESFFLKKEFSAERILKLSKEWQTIQRTAYRNGIHTQTYALGEYHRAKGEIITKCSVYSEKRVLDWGFNLGLYKMYSYKRKGIQRELMPSLKEIRENKFFEKHRNKRKNAFKIKEDDKIIKPSPKHIRDKKFSPLTDNTIMPNSATNKKIYNQMFNKRKLRIIKIEIPNEEFRLKFIQYKIKQINTRTILKEREVELRRKVWINSLFR